MKARAHPHLLAWWTDDPADPGRASADDPDVQRLAGAIAPGAHVSDLGGVMSFNVRLDPIGLVLRLHQPFVSRARLLAVQDVRRRVADHGLRVPVPLAWRDARTLRCRNRWAELEAYLPHERLAPTRASYAGLFAAMGTLHRVLGTIDLPVPRPVVATYEPPRSLRRWVPATEAAVRGDPEARERTRLLGVLVQQLAGQWVPATALPRQLVHGDVRLSNVGRSPHDTPIYLDFGFLALRPRVHDLAYALAFMVAALDGAGAPETFAWASVGEVIAAYEDAAHARLTPQERQALVPYTVAVCLYHAALAGFSADPAGELRDRQPFLSLSAWLLDHPAALLS